MTPEREIVPDPAPPQVGAPSGTPAEVGHDVPPIAAEHAAVLPPPTTPSQRRTRRPLRRWLGSRDRWVDAGERWAFAGQQLRTGSTAARPARDPGDRRGVVPTEILPLSVQIVVAWAAALLVVAGAALVVMEVVGSVAVVVIPLSVAVLLTALLHPLARGLSRGLHLHRAVAAAVTVVGFAGLLTTGAYVAGTELAVGLSDMTTRVVQGVSAVVDWLRTGPLQLSSEQLDTYGREFEQTVRSKSTTISEGAIAAGLTTIDLVAGTIICLISTFFFLYDGQRIWSFLTRLLPSGARRPVFEAGRRGWVSLSAYSRTQVIVAAVDACGIAGGAFFLGLPLVVPLFFIVLVASVVPIVGASVAGTVPVLIAFVVEGPVTALLMLLIVVAVQQFEAHVMQPFLMGRAVDLHPLAVIVAVTAAAYLFGVAGALFAVPVLAFVNMAVRYLLGDDPFPEIGDLHFILPDEARPDATEAPPTQ